MNAIAIISISITISGFLIGIISSVSKLAGEYGKLKNQVETNERRDVEERNHTREKFSELYNRTASHDTSLAALSNNVNSLSATCSRIESKLDRMIEQRGQ